MIAWETSIHGDRRRLVKGIEFDVLRYEDSPRTSPTGLRTLLPEAIRWTIPDPDHDTGVINGVIDTEWIYGLGTGWIAGYASDSTYGGQAVAGRGYIEFADQRRPRDRIGERVEPQPH